jgi:hypothetical protein
MLLARRQHLGVAVQAAAGRGVDHAPHAGGPRRLEHLDRPEDVHPGVEHRILDGAPHVDLRRQMEHRVGSCPGEDAGERRAILHVGDVQHRARALRCSEI